ncbi:hypothetical protein [Aliarcobacter lanthieri]|uniref:hypothetical protein n=1 Tax=Aliarcobacter lanthieri TaxID=1355374 RepID=UPI00047B97CB|nr:hypothetical protein [Aliarcobacter lanthieri]QKF58900.1 hypothetical protein ALANTH_0778 [Aliarcobacter lanthieri]
MVVVDIDVKLLLNDLFESADVSFTNIDNMNPSIYKTIFNLEKRVNQLENNYSKDSFICNLDNKSTYVSK